MAIRLDQYNNQLYVSDTVTANAPLVLQPQGTGALQAQQTDSTATGGNARGANAVDWQTSRSSAAQVASGAGCIISGGLNNTSQGNYNFVGGGQSNSAIYSNGAVVGGAGNYLQANYGFIGGGNNNTITFGAGSGNSWSFIGCGYTNVAHGVYNVVVGGSQNSGTTASTIASQSATMNGTTAVTLSGSNASIKVGQKISGTYINDADTYVAAISGTSLTLSKNATGSGTATLSFYTPHGIVVGGGNNQATGSYSFIGGGGDAGTAGNRNVASGAWSTVAGGAKNTASGAGSTVAGGGTDGVGNYFANTASGTTSFVGGGWNNTASSVLSTIGGGTSNTASNASAFVGGGDNNTANGANSSIVGGRKGTTRSIVGNFAFPACFEPVSATQGSSQAALVILGKQTTDATATVITSDGAAGGTTNQVILPNNSAYFFTGEVVAGVTGGGNTKGWKIEGVIKRGANAASTALVGTPTVTSTYADAGASTWVIAVTADTTNGGLAVTFTGQASTTIRVVCQIRSTEMTF